MFFITVSSGASPDGIVGRGLLVPVQSQNNATGPPEIVEIKCPFKAKDMTVAEAAASLKDFYIGWFIEILTFYSIQKIHRKHQFLK